MEHLIHALQQHSAQNALFTASPPLPHSQLSPDASALSAQSLFVPAPEMLAVLASLAACAPGSAPLQQSAAHQSEPRLQDAATAASGADQWAANDLPPLQRLAQLWGTAEWQGALISQVAPLLATCWRQNVQLPAQEAVVEEKAAATPAAYSVVNCEPSPLSSSTSLTCGPPKKRSAIRFGSGFGGASAAAAKSRGKPARASFSDSLLVSPASDRDAREDVSATASASAAAPGASSGAGSGSGCGERVPLVELSARVVGELAKIENRLGDYVCRLCGVRFEHAVALANHSCPRLVAAEHRCGDCGKLFSCPANLASHRRWHVRRATLAAAVSAPTAASAAASTGTLLSLLLTNCARNF